MIPVRLTAGFRLMQAAAGAPRRFKILAYTGGKLRVSGFPQPVVIDLMKLEAGRVQILLNHEETTDATVGMADAIDNTGKALVLAGVVTGTSPRVQNVLHAHDNGQQWEASVGCVVHETRDIPPGQTIVVNGQRQSGPFILATRSTLKETSVLPLGADSGTSVNLAAAAAKGNAMSFEQWLESMGIDATKLTEPAQAALMQAFEAEQAGGGTGEPTPVASAAALLNLRASGAAELHRQNEIRRLCGSRLDIAATAVSQNWSPDKTELAMLKAQRPAAPNSFVRSGNGLGELSADKVLTASLCLTAGCRPEVLASDSQYGEKVVDAATSLAHRGATIHTVLRACMSAAGVTPPSAIVGDAFIRAGFEASRTLKAAGITPMSLPGILSNTANKLLLSAFDAVPATWPEFCAQTSLENFKEAKRYRMVTGGEFEELAPGGHLRHISFKPEDEYTNQAKTYGAVVQLDRTSLVNDDLGAFSTLLTSMGRAGMTRMERKVYELLLSTIEAAAFFTTLRGNLLTGAGSALDIEALSAAVAAFDAMTDANGEPLMMNPEVILTGPTLANTAKLLTRDTTVVAVGVGNTAATIPDGNPHAGAYRPVKSPWLENDLLTGNTATGWLLAAPPQGEAGLMEVGFLNGQKTPTTEEGELDFTQLGVAMRAYFDFGIAMSDYRFGVWNAGA